MPSLSCCWRVLHTLCTYDRLLSCCLMRVSSTTSSQRHHQTDVKKVKFSHTHYRALGPELIQVYRQSARRWCEVNHAIDLAVGCHYFLPGQWLPPKLSPVALPVNGSTHLIPASFSFVDPERMKGWVGLVGWPIADGLPTLVVTHQLQVERRTGKVRQGRVRGGDCLLFI